MSARARRELVTDVVLGLLGSGVALVLLRLANDAWQPGWAGGCGIFGGVLVRRAVAPGYSSFPEFLQRPLDVGVMLVGTVLACWGMVLGQGWTHVLANYWAAVSLPLTAALLGLSIAAAVYTHARMRREVEEHRIREAVLRETALRARLKALQAQINPHFLFNSFNALAELTHDDPDRAERMIGDLSHLLRYSMRTSASRSVTLGQELEAVERYLRVERARLGERLQVERQVDGSVLETAIPGLILQPLVENAVQHAVAPRPEGGSVQIRVTGDGHRVEMMVEDDGPGLPPDVEAQVERLLQTDDPEVIQAGAAGTSGAGGGLANVLQRLTLGYRGAAVVSVEEPAPSGLRIRISLPRELS